MKATPYHHPRSLQLVTATATIGALFLASCGTIAGIGGTSDYGCKAPSGVHCESVSGVYYNSVRDNLPAQRQQGSTPSSKPSKSVPIPSKSDPAPSRLPVAVSPVSPATLSATPLRSESRILRLRVAPWEDADGDLMDQTYAYVVVNEGRWLVDHAKRRIKEAYAPVRAPAASDNSLDRSAAPSASGVGKPPVAKDSTGIAKSHEGGASNAR